MDPPPVLSSTFPLPPMGYIELFSDDNIRQDHGRILQPPPPIEGPYELFGVHVNGIDNTEPIIRPLEAQQIQRIYMNPEDYKGELKKLCFAILTNYLDLLQIVSRSSVTPSRDSGNMSIREQKLAEIELLFVNIHHLINELRPHQARETLRVILEEQKQQREKTSDKLYSFLNRIVDVLNSAVYSLNDLIEMWMAEDDVQLPNYLVFKPSKSKIGQNGLFANRTLQPNEPLGVYRGKIRRTLPQTADEEYVWAILTTEDEDLLCLVQVLSARGVPVFYIDASNPNDGNFLRFIRWTHDKAQQNVVCMQQNQQIHYFSLKTIQPDDELLTYMERQKSKKKEKRENGRTRRETRQQQSTQHQDNPAIKIFEHESNNGGNEFIDEDAVNLVMNNRSLEFELQITKKYLSETFVSDGIKQTCLKCDICHQIFMSNVAFKFHYHTYHITPQYLSPANRPRTKVRDSCNICRYSAVPSDVKSVLVDILEIISGGERLQENRFVRVHLYRCHWCAPIDAHYNTAKQLAQHMRAKHYRLLQALLSTQADMFHNDANRGKKLPENEHDENSLNSNLSTTSTPENISSQSLNRGCGRSSNSNYVLQSNTNHDTTPRLPIPIGLPDPLTDRDCQQLFTIGEQVAYNMTNCIDGTLEDIQQNETFCRRSMDDDNSKVSSLELFLNHFPLARDRIGPKRRQESFVQYLSNDYFQHPKTTTETDGIKPPYQRQKIIPERAMIDRYLCILCNDRFSTSIDLIEHERIEHGRNVSRFDWGWDTCGKLASNPYAFILELENELKHQQTRSDSPTLSLSSTSTASNGSRRKTTRQRSTSSNDRTSTVTSEDNKPISTRLLPKRVKREIYRSNTCPMLNSVDDSRSGQRKSKRLQKATTTPTPAVSPSHGSIPESGTSETVPSVKIEENQQAPSLPVFPVVENTNPTQIIVKTDKRFYWCTKCSKLYLNLISLYTESHYRQCVGEQQHFNVINDPSFFNSDEVIKQMPSHVNRIKVDQTNAPVDVVRKKDTISISKTEDSNVSRTYFINGKPVRMETTNRPITVKDLRQQFQASQSQQQQQQSSPSEEYIYQRQSLPSKIATPSRMSSGGGGRASRPTATPSVSAMDPISLRTLMPIKVENDSSSTEAPSSTRRTKLVPTPRSLDRFEISSDDDNNTNVEEEKSPNNTSSNSSNSSKISIDQQKSVVKQEIEKTLVKRRHDSEYASSTTTTTITTIAAQADVEIESKRKRTKQQSISRKSQPPQQSLPATKTSLKRSVSQPYQDVKPSVRRTTWKKTADDDDKNNNNNLNEQAEPVPTANNRNHIPEALQDYDHVCSKCNMPFFSQSSLDEHQNGQCLEMNVLASCGSWFRCPLCSLTYCDANLMSLHINKTHRDVLRSNQRATTQRRLNPRTPQPMTSTMTSRSVSSSSEHHLRKFS